MLLVPKRSLNIFKTKASFIYVHVFIIPPAEGEVGYMFMAFVCPCIWVFIILWTQDIMGLCVPGLLMMVTVKMQYLIDFKSIKAFLVFVNFPNIFSFPGENCAAGIADCKTGHWLIKFLLAAYLLVGNILLLNLLIAIFRYV